LDDVGFGNWKCSPGSHFAEGIDGCLAVTGLDEDIAADSLEAADISN